MGQTEAAQRGIVDAILGLNVDAIFQEPLNDLWKSVYPKYLALTSPVPEGPSFASVDDIPRYAPYSDIRSQQRGECERALQEWARRLRLTHDLTDTGDCLSWVLDFGRTICSGRPVIVWDEPPLLKMAPPGNWVQVERPRPSETFPEWARRIRPSLRAFYKGGGHVPRPSRRRNPDRYKWFVLHVCAGFSYDRISNEMSLPRNAVKAHRELAVGGDAVRKGIAIVLVDLGLSRKVRPGKRPKIGVSIP